jgi:hypothetical protein
VAPRKRRRQDRQSERRGGVGSAVGSRCCDCIYDARALRTANGRRRRVQDPTARRERSDGCSGRTPHHPPRHAAPTTGEVACGSPHNRARQSSSQPSQINPQKRGGKATAPESRSGSSAKHPRWSGSRSSSPRNGAVLDMAGHPRLPNQRPLFRVTVRGAAGGSHGSVPNPRSSFSTSERS